MLKGMEKIFDVSTGGFLRPAADDNGAEGGNGTAAEETKKQGVGGVDQSQQPGGQL